MPSEIPGIPLKRLYSDLLELIQSELQCWDYSLKGTTDIVEELNYLSSGQELGDAVFPQTEVLAETIVPLLSSPPLKDGR